MKQHVIKFDTRGHNRMLSDLRKDLKLTYDDLYGYLEIDLPAKTDKDALIEVLDKITDHCFKAGDKDKYKWTWKQVRTEDVPSDDLRMYIGYKLVAEVFTYHHYHSVFLFKK